MIINVIINYVNNYFALFKIILLVEFLIKNKIKIK